MKEIDHHERITILIVVESDAYLLEGQGSLHLRSIGLGSFIHRDLHPAADRSK